MVQKIFLKMHPLSCANTHCEVTDLEICGMLGIEKLNIQKWNMNLLRNKILNLCVRWYTLGSFGFVAEVTFNSLDSLK